MCQSDVDRGRGGTRTCHSPVCFKRLGTTSFCPLGLSPLSLHAWAYGGGPGRKITLVFPTDLHFPNGLLRGEVEFWRELAVVVECIGGQDGASKVENENAVQVSSCRWGLPPQLGITTSVFRV